MGDQKDEIPENIKDQMSGYENAGRAFSAPQLQPIQQQQQRPFNGL